MQRHALSALLTLIFSCTALQADFDDDSREAQSDLAIQFDDFPDNSEPDIELLLYDEKNFDEFGQAPTLDETIKEQSKLAIDIHGIPSAIVNGCVNVISGEYQEVATDYTLPGAVPLNLQRYYCGGKCTKASFLNGWQLSHGAKLLSYIDPKHYDCAILKGSDRHGTQFKKQDYKHCYSCPDAFFKNGVTNCAFGELSAQTNFKNDRLYKQNKGFDLETSDQTTYSFVKSSYDPERESKTHGYRLELLTLPDGTAYKYRYSQPFGMPTSISLLNRKGVLKGDLKLKEIPWQSEFQENPELIYLTSTGEEIKYRFHIYGSNRAILSEVVPPHGPKVKYSYEDINDNYKKKRLTSRKLPDQRQLKIAYYQCEDKLCKNKVGQLISPCGKGGELVATHVFEYFKCFGPNPLDNRSAIVTNALGGKTRYTWNKKGKRLNGITHLDSNDSPIYSEKYVWGDDWEDQSHLTARLLEDNKGSLLAYLKYQYDEYGNLTRTSLYGDLTGERSSSEIKNIKEAQDSYDCFQVKCRYDSHKRRILEDDGRTVQLYKWKDETNLLTAHLISYLGRIQVRHFYEHDVSGAVCLEITDDGSTEESNDLTDVTERLIKITQNDKLGLPIIIKEQALDLSTGKLSKIRKTVNQYDRHGWLVAQSIYGSDGKLAYTQEWQHDAHGNIIYEKNALGFETVSEYDLNNNLIFEKKSDGAARVLTYDRMNKLIHEEQQASNGDRLHKSFRYDAMGNCVSSFDQYDHETVKNYDSQGRLLKTVYHGAGKREISYARNALGMASQIEDGNGYVTSISYNLRGKPTLISHPDGVVEKNSYNIWGDLIKTVSRDDIAILYSYDAQGREIEKKWVKGNTLLKSITKKYNAFHLICETDSKGNETHYSYDATGKQISEVRGNKRTYYKYDVLGNKEASIILLENDRSISHIEKHDVAGQVIESYTINSDGQVLNKIETRYDAHGHEIEKINDGQAITRTNYDPFGRVICTINPLGEATHTTYQDSLCAKEVTNSLGVKTTTTYDCFGQPILEQRFDQMGALIEEISYAYDGNGNKILRKEKTQDQPIITRWQYDLLNRLIKTTEAQGTYDQKVVKYHYDTAGRMTEVEKADDVILHYTYDPLGRRISLKSSDGTLAYSYRYDKNDNLLVAGDEIQNTRVLRTYDIHNQMISETLPYGHSIGYSYDLLGNISCITLPDQSQICYEREGEVLKQIRRIGKLDYTHSYLEFDEALNPTKVRLAKQAGEIAVDYDLLNRPTEICSDRWQEKLTYKAHLLEKRSVRDQIDETASNYLYDARDQIISEDGTANHQFEYDWQGNPICYDAKQRTFNARNALVHDGQNEYEYDDNGNRIADGTNLYFYDALDRLCEVEKPERSYQYVYDGLGRRVARFDEGKITYYLWQKDQEIGRISSGGTIKELQVLSPSNRAVAFELKGKLFVPLHDIFGHVRTLLDEEGHCQATYRYSSFGEEQIFGDILSPWRYAGKRTDKETGFIYFGERYYDPQTLTWISADPLEDADGPNLYAYVHNNPLFYVDLDGCFSWDWLSSTAVQVAMVCVDVALVASTGVFGVAEGLVCGLSGGLTGTAIDLAIDAYAIYGQGGVSAACAGASTSTITYNVCKTIGQVAGAAISLTPLGKSVQAGMGGVSSGLNLAKGVKSTVVAKTATNIASKCARTVTVVNSLGQKVTVNLIEGTRKGGMKHLLRDHLAISTAKNSSKYLPGIGAKEVEELIIEGCKRGGEWEIHSKSGLRSIVVDMGRYIGTKRSDNSLTTKMKIVLNGDDIHTAFPF